MSLPEDARYEWKAPNGVIVRSTVPQVEDKWWDHAPLHLIWSYGSWISWVLLDYGRPGLRLFLARRGWWKAPKTEVVNRQIARRIARARERHARR